MNTDNVIGAIFVLGIILNLAASLLAYLLLNEEQLDEHHSKIVFGVLFCFGSFVLPLVGLIVHYLPMVRNKVQKKLNPQ